MTPSTPEEFPVYRNELTLEFPAPEELPEDIIEHVTAAEVRLRPMHFPFNEMSFSRIGHSAFHRSLQEAPPEPDAVRPAMFYKQEAPPEPAMLTRGSCFLFLTALPCAFFNKEIKLFLRILSESYRI